MTNLKARLEALPRYERDIEVRQGGHYGEEQWSEAVMNVCEQGAWVKWRDVAALLVGSESETCTPNQLMTAQEPSTSGNPTPSLVASAEDTSCIASGNPQMAATKITSIAALSPTADLHGGLTASTPEQRAVGAASTQQDGTMTTEWTFTEYSADGGKGVVVLTKDQADRVKQLLSGADQDAELRPLVQALVDKLDVIIPIVDGYIGLQHIRSGGQYSGPNLVKELADVKAALVRGK